MVGDTGDTSGSGVGVGCAHGNPAIPARSRSHEGTIAAMRLGRLAPLLLLLVISLLVTGPAGPASRGGPGPDRAEPDGHVDLRRPGRAPCACCSRTPPAPASPPPTVAVERRVGGTWRAFATLATDDAGRAATDALLSKEPADNVFRATYAGDATTYAGSTSGPVAVPLVRRTSVLELGGPTSVVDEQSVPIEVTWRTGTGDPVAGEVAVYRRVGDSLAAGPPRAHRRRRDRPLQRGTAHRHPLAGPRRATGLGRGRPQRHPRHRQPAARHAGGAAGRRAPARS